MLSKKIRRQFLQYFKNNGHIQLPSSPVVPHDDPTLLFTNAGMNQFKDIFLGKSERDFKRAVTSQKCIRVGGKHNDLENVGHTARHLTFFEMLGNFSFGDYFKKEAIAFAWEATTKIFEFDPHFLWATVFYEDEEAFELWKAFLPEERIIRMGKKDNFWAMGDTGPCGPCSELYYDRGSKFGSSRSPAEDIEGTRFLEFWNLVFMEYNLDPTGKMESLPKKSVDTGAGLERIISLIMGVDTLFEIDTFTTLIQRIEKISKQTYDPKKTEAAAFKVIADHLRTLAFAIGDGVQPSNLDRGYVLRKVLRRAVRYGRQLGLDKPFLADILPALIETMGEDFPELVSAEQNIAFILTQEEENFLRTLRRGGNILSQIIQQSAVEKQISGDDAFKLKDTYGLPLEEILLLAKDAHLSVDIKKFEKLEIEAKNRSKEARKSTSQTIEKSQYEEFRKTSGASIFLGYKEISSEGIILGIIRDGGFVNSLYAGEEGILILDRTPFYGEKGGQVGDQGYIETEGTCFEVLDCQIPYTEVITHKGIVQQGELHVGDLVTATVNFQRRQKIARHHTATHLLHWALQMTFGEHLRQAGSVVESSRLRFDFNHPKALTVEEIEQIEDVVNEKIRANTHVETYELPLAEVQENRSIKQFFGEKYSSIVRVVDIDYSKELCGGTHVQSTGEIGYFRILKEGSIASGVRRIEAVAGSAAEKHARDVEKMLSCAAHKLNTSPLHLLEKIDALQHENKSYVAEISKLQRELLSKIADALLLKKEHTHTIPFLAQIVSIDPKNLEILAELLVEKQPSLILLLIATQDQKCTFVSRITADFVNKGFKANELIQVVATILQGKGGGKPDAARGGGVASERTEEALQKAHLWIEQKSS